MKKILLRLFLVMIFLAIITPPALYFGGKAFAHWYANSWADKMIDLEEKGLLSTSFGAAWTDVVYGDKMDELSQVEKEKGKRGGPKIVSGIPVEDYPSLKVVEKLNKLNKYSNQITILDRNGKLIADIKTDHRRAPYDSIPKVLIGAVLGAEDKTFFENSYGFEFDSFVRAAGRSIISSVKKMRKVSPKGTSTVTQQVAKMFVSQLDSKGQRYVSRSVDRKLREIRIAAALRKMYTPEEIMEVYMNHCLTSSYGLIGVADISRGLFGKEAMELSDAECVYLARMVKWGTNIPTKIKRQCRIDMPRMATILAWDSVKVDSVLAEIDTMTFQKPKQIETAHGHLVDLANVYWHKFLRQNGYSEKEIIEFDLIDPESLIRKKGNAEIRLTIDLPLQKFLEEQVKKRGYGKDTTIVTDVRVGSFGEDVELSYRPKDTIRQLTTLTKATKFSDPDKEFYTLLDSGETLITNIRYKKLEKNRYRRSVFYYGRRPVLVDGQYFSYGIIDSKTGKLRAYYSRDRLGSRAAGLINRSVPNGSSTAKPILNALMMDLKEFSTISKWNDTLPVEDTTLAWRRTIRRTPKGGGEVSFLNTENRRPYRVRNHGYHLEGENFIFDLLATSNNIFAVENIYRLDGTLFDKAGKIDREKFALGQLLYRLGIYERMKKEFAGREITGVRVYKEIARIVGADVDAVSYRGKKYPISDKLYSIALGTLELTLLEQMHLFNMLYSNQLIKEPKEHPSLFIDKIVLQGKEYLLDTVDAVTKYHPFSSKNALRPTQLGLHKRLSGKWDGLKAYDVLYPKALPADTIPFSDSLMSLTTPLSNFAKSGTSDDILRPYNADVTTKKRTNYCHWNGVVRVDLGVFDTTSKKSEIVDLTVACIGEGNRKNTGPRDGKSLHRFLTKSLLKKGGIKVKRGKRFYVNYENLLKRGYSDSLKLVAAKDSLTQADSLTKSGDSTKTTMFGVEW